ATGCAAREERAVRPRVWAPFAERSVTLVLDGERQPMRPAGGGWWEADRAAAPGSRYAFAVDGGEPRADPRALSLPDGPEGSAQVLDSERLSATSAPWDGRQLPGSVIYELHVGTFTDEGTLDSAIERLDHLAEFGPYFTKRYGTPWGDAVNLDDAGSDDVRRFIIDNALMWLRDFHVDGLRLDAVHALYDGRALTLLEELSAEVAALSATLG